MESTERGRRMTQTLAAFNAASIARRMNSAAGTPVFALAAFRRSIISRGRKTFVRIIGLSDIASLPECGHLALRLADFALSNFRRWCSAKRRPDAVRARDTQIDAAKRAVLICVDGRHVSQPPERTASDGAADHDDRVISDGQNRVDQHAGILGVHAVGDGLGLGVLHGLLRVGPIPTMCQSYATYTHVATGNCGAAA